MIYHLIVEFYKVGYKFFFLPKLKVFKEKTLIGDNFLKDLKVGDTN